jgi:L-asparagine transporter-like permease
MSRILGRDVGLCRQRDARETMISKAARSVSAREVTMYIGGGAIVLILIRA